MLRRKDVIVLVKTVIYSQAQNFIRIRKTIFQRKISRFDKYVENYVKIIEYFHQKIASILFAVSVLLLSVTIWMCEKDAKFHYEWHWFGLPPKIDSSFWKCHLTFDANSQTVIRAAVIISASYCFLTSTKYVVLAKCVWNWLGVINSRSIED